VHARIGTSGFSYVEWRGTFYPEGMKEADMLAFYSKHLTSVEINNTFYRMPRASMLEGWGSQTPAEFRFVLKAPRRITHIQKLKGAADSVRYLFEAAAALGPKLGPVLFQLPPFSKKDAPCLRDFLGGLPEGARAAFEFRHPSWFDDEVFEILKSRDAALCGGDVDEEGRSPPFVKTASWSYLRLRRSDYAPGEIEDWARRIAELGFSDVYAFFKHEERGPELAGKLQALLDQDRPSARP
jgi:uncharacterized protein YecE (DUF72 family)